MNSYDLMNALFESSSLRPDLLVQIREIFIDIVMNVKLDGELMARVNNNTYKFIKDIKK